MKKWVIALVLISAVVVFAGGLVFVCGLSARHVFLSVIGNRLDHSDIRVKFFDQCVSVVPVVSQWKEWFDEKNYIVLLQNSNEIRPSGGFMGSYLKIETEKSGIRGMVVEDIYNPDGQIKGHVDPPYPIQEAFGQGWWRLRDANWDADFTSSAPTIAWFFEQGGEVKPDGIVAVNLELVKKFLGVVGPLQMETYDETVTETNLELLAQKYAEVGFVPGSTQKRDFLGAVAARIQGLFPVLGVRQKIGLAQLILEELNKGEILLWFENEQMQQVVINQGWSGRLKIDANKDFLFIVESNLGVNKANCCVFKEVEHRIHQKEDRLIIEWKNENPLDTPQPPVFFGGRYLAYVRILRPEGYEVDSVVVGGKKLGPLPQQLQLIRTPLWREKTMDYYQLSSGSKFTQLGFWVTVDAQAANQVEIVMRSGGKFADILVQKQPGAKPYIYRLKFEDKESVAKNIDRSVNIPIK